MQKKIVAQVLLETLEHFYTKAIESHGYFDFLVTFYDSLQDVIND